MINIQNVAASKIKDVDFSKLTFGSVFSDHMFQSDYKDGEWINSRIEPLDYLQIHPGNLAWHYGQSIFEGMKATIDRNGVPLLFRPEQHILRLNKSAVRMCMPEFPSSLFLDAVNTLVDLEKNWIPKEKGSALYLRPLMIAMDEAIGVRPSTNYKFMIMALPVGPYYAKPISLLAEEKYVRAAFGGVGGAKTAGNYAASLYPAKLAIEKGFDQVLWLDSQEFKYVQEVGTMNIFFVFKDKIVTPITDGCILEGITRSSIIDILIEKGHHVEVRKISINEVIQNHEDNNLLEIFGTGTAAVVSQINKLSYKNKEYTLNLDIKSLALELKDYISGIRSGEIIEKWGWIQPVKLNSVL